MPTFSPQPNPAAPLAAAEMTAARALPVGEERRRDAIALRISVTDRCQLRCGYCMPAEGVKPRRHDEILRYEDIARFTAAVHRLWGVSSLRITGGEPLVRRGVENLIQMLGDLRLPDLAMTTNGQQLAVLAKPLRRAGLDRVNVSLDSLDVETYRTLTRGGDLNRTLAGLDAAQKAGLTPIRVNTVALRGINDGELAAIARHAMSRCWEPRFLELMPVEVSPVFFARHAMSGEQVLARLRAEFSVTPLGDRVDGTACRYRVGTDAGPLGVVGLITGYSTPFCGGCRRLRLTATGELVGCLARGRQISLLSWLATPPSADADGLLRQLVDDAMTGKRQDRRFAGRRHMSVTGG